MMFTRLWTMDIARDAPSPEDDLAHLSLSMSIYHGLRHNSACGALFSLAAAPPTCSALI